MELTTYIWGCIFYMLGSICFVIGTGFYLAVDGRPEPTEARRATS